MNITLQALINLLTPARLPVAAIWRELGISRGELGELVKRYRNELADVGIMLHVATTSQASAQRLHIETDGQRVATLSRPGASIGRSSAVGRYINNYLDSMEANSYELEEIKTIIEARLAAQVEEKPQATGKHITYRQEYAKCGKTACTKCNEGPGHGPYWYAYHREGGKLKKKYLGKQRPAH